MPAATYLNLDDAWGDAPLGLPMRDARNWGPKLRYIASKKDVEAFWTEVAPDLGDFVLYGSGDFHHLAGALIRRVKTPPFMLISFDNHPDWDMRPPYWACGGWAARTLQTGQVEKVSVWGCGNFELRWPARLFADWRQLRFGQLEIHAWAERQSAAVQRKFNCMTGQNWRQRFENFASTLSGRAVYVTVDMDCLNAKEAITNWENGLFTADDVAWAIGILRKQAKLVGGDICGAYSPPVYERFGQRFAGNWDHPRLPVIDWKIARGTNLKSLAPIWGAMTECIH